MNDYVRNMIQRDQQRAAKLAALQRLIEEGEQSGVSPLSAEEIVVRARRRPGVEPDDL